MTTYYIYRVKIDRRFKLGYRPESFKYIGEAVSYSSALNEARRLKTDGYITGVEAITLFT